MNRETESESPEKERNIQQIVIRRSNKSHKKIELNNIFELYSKLKINDSKFPFPHNNEQKIKS